MTVRSDTDFWARHGVPAECPSLVASLDNYCARASGRVQKLSKFRVDMLIAKIDQELDVLHDLQYGSTQRESLRCHFRPITVMDAVMPSLDEVAKPLVHLTFGLFAGRVFFSRGHRVVCRAC